MMRLSSLFLVGLILCGLGGSKPGLAQDVPTAAQRAEVARQYGLDPNSALESRVQAASPTVLKMFEALKGPAPTPHTLTEPEKRQLAEAFAVLTPLHQRVLRERLRSVNFLNGMPNTALTSIVNPMEPFPLFDITIRAAILHQNVSEWLTEKERTCFDASASPLSISIEAGTRDALAYVLLHEATHVLDASLGITPPFSPGEPSPSSPPPTAFTRDVWSERTTPAPPYRDPLREHIRFYFGKPLPIDQAEAVYASLRRTPFVSLYGSTSWGDDLAEYVAVYHWTSHLKQPYRIILRKDGKQIFAYEPMKSNLVRGRIDQMKPFYTKDRQDRAASSPSPLF